MCVCVRALLCARVIVLDHCSLVVEAMVRERERVVEMSMSMSLGTRNARMENGGIVAQKIPVSLCSWSELTALYIDDNRFGMADESC